MNMTINLSKLNKKIKLRKFPSQIKDIIRKATFSPMTSFCDKLVDVRWKGQEGTLTTSNSLIASS